MMDGPYTTDGVWISGPHIDPAYGGVYGGNSAKVWTANLNQAYAAGVRAGQAASAKLTADLEAAVEKNDAKA